MRVSLQASDSLAFRMDSKKALLGPKALELLSIGLIISTPSRDSMSPRGLTVLGFIFLPRTADIIFAMIIAIQCENPSNFPKSQEKERKLTKIKPHPSYLNHKNHLSFKYMGDSTFPHQGSTQRRKEGSTSGKSWSSFFGIIGTFVGIWVVFHYSASLSLAQSSLNERKFSVSRAEIERVHSLLQESKALLAELKGTNISLSAHASDSLSSASQVDSSIANEFRALERKYAEVNTELMSLKSQGGLPSGESESVSQLQKCKQQLAHSEAAAVNGSHSSLSDSSDGKDAWLVIGIPTVSRAANQDYLLQTLSSIERQMPTDPNDLLYHKVKVIVVNVEGKSHKRFYEAVDLFSRGRNKPDSTFGLFEFITLSEEYKESTPEWRDPKQGATAANDVGNANFPGYRVRKQTRSIAQVLKRSKGLGKFYMFLEDDMLLCPNGFHSIQYMLSKASRYSPDWLALRASYGMNGIFIHDKDIAHFYHYLLDNQKRRPPDHLAVEWFAGETKVSRRYKNGRMNMAYRFNIFDHIGVSSTLRSVKQTSFPGCYDSLGEPTLFEVEAFDPRKCPRDDIWPCEYDKSAPTVPNTLVPQAKAISYTSRSWAMS